MPSSCAGLDDADKLPLRRPREPSPSIVRSSAEGRYERDGVGFRALEVLGTVTEGMRGVNLGPVAEDSKLVM